MPRDTPVRSVHDDRRVTFTPDDNVQTAMQTPGRPRVDGAPVVDGPARSWGCCPRAT